ncbi:hypothetical protein [Phormidium tenue]|jgi:hypothetical protein|uniref:Uncharacterized protein n=1 Tax=Phormidium tenue FACHB-1050 TaxID=2692857 RepID=A0ABR8C959_9CYAN|nr:hypothetical protein [Phormidium tenue]MBD2316700.1 hypothetical protein [Phormidium tenue FACHB-1050]
MTDPIPSIKDRVNAAAPKAPRNTKKSTSHDAADTVSKNAKKSQIADITSAITSKAIADADVFADELYSEAFLNRLGVKREGIEALSFTQLQGKAKLKTAHVLAGGQQLQLASSEPEPVKIFACEDWLGDDDE